MTTTTPVPNRAPRDLWTAACTAAAFVSLLVIVAHVVGPRATGTAIPYAGGAAVVLGLGAAVASRLWTPDARLAAAVGIAGLLGLRLLSALRPDLLASRHGTLSAADAATLAVLIVASVALLLCAPRRVSAGRPPNPTACPGG